ncbi:MAG: hypothetical protein KKD63_09260 [Proteobacteria bacterium]|nr:hypothetical protein [Desulfobulbaceae bacterium]MBU4153055.1 hypothetical protein [Pseudomonadota bacterium]MDP2105629.1 hypothetical protein [Desulfobulbaceae bacterium]
MAEIIPHDIKEDLKTATILHQRAASDYEKCLEFNKLMSDLLGRLEDADCHKTAGRVMGILIDCNPKKGASCEKATLVGDKVKKL